MASTHAYAANELPGQYSPHGYTWLYQRLLDAGYTSPAVYDDPDVSGGTILSVAEDNVSKNQLAFDVQPTDGALAANYESLNVAPTFSTSVTITGPVGKPVKVRFEGIGFVSETEFTIPGNNNYEFVLGPCPAGQRVVTPQMYDFYVEDGSCSPVAVMVTFK